jgi:predicted nucleic acid-binding protein
MIVADTSVIAYLLIDGARTASAREVWKRDPDWRVPPLWRAEFLNVLATAVKSKVLRADQAQTAWLAAASLMRGREVEPSGTDVLATAIRSGISAYDAQFVVVARRLATKLVTGDRRLSRACPDVAVAMG